MAVLAQTPTVAVETSDAAVVTSDVAVEAQIVDTEIVGVAEVQVVVFLQIAIHHLTHQWCQGENNARSRRLG